MLILKYYLIYLTAKSISRNFKKISINLLIFLINFLILGGRLLAVFFINLVFKPGFIVSRFLFHQLAVRLYRLYLGTMKRLDLKSGLQNKSLSFFARGKLIHLTVAALTVIFVIFNLTHKTQAISPEEIAGNTFLSEIISPEFSGSNQLIEEYFDEEAVISPVQQTYLDNLTAVRVQPAAEMQSPEEDSLFENAGGLSGGAIIKPDLAATAKTIRPRQDVIDHVVLAGDTVSTIAAQFGVSVNTILWENNLSAYSLIRPGDKLAILPVSGISHNIQRGDTLAAIAIKYGIDANAILETNKLASADTLIIGKKIIIPGGKRTYYAAPVAAQRGVSGVSVIKDLLKPDSLKSIITNKLAWPTIGARITQYYSWRHHAIDIANKTGTPVYATDSGVVETAGWGTGYGNQIVVDHGGGRKSRYAHLSKFYVFRGESVNKGEAIASMGSTGYSTGPHVHFEYIINGIKYNPLNYLK